MVRSGDIKGIHICSMQTLKWCPTRLSTWSTSILLLFLLSKWRNSLSWVYHCYAHDTELILCFSLSDTAISIWMAGYLMDMLLWLMDGCYAFSYQDLVIYPKQLQEPWNCSWMAAYDLKLLMNNPRDVSSYQDLVISQNQLQEPLDSSGQPAIILCLMRAFANFRPFRLWAVSGLQCSACVAG